MNNNKEYSCDYCKYNVGHDGNGFDHRYPCDQQNCWWVLINRSDEENSINTEDDYKQGVI